jgi:hypothetical protein
MRSKYYFLLCLMISLHAIYTETLYMKTLFPLSVGFLCTSFLPVKSKRTKLH